MIRRTSGIGRPEPESEVEPRGRAVPLPGRASEEERDRARLYAASRATNADDLRTLLDALGLNDGSDQ
ncbi:hypothetical protein ACGFWI_00975 [Streptomyces sp. NPDC048434]|uniref:hypothetical protein n=1 Tax=Streptomyces sp. NPDC048434 TaxID=3365549 RepID=UPI003714BFA8